MSRELDIAPVVALAQEAVRLEAAAVAAVEEQIDESLPRVAQQILACRGKVLVTGSGTSGTIARRMAHLLSVSGTPALFVHPMDALHGTMGAIQPQDLMILLSKGGESDEINQLCQMIAGQGSVTVGVGEAPGSTLARSCQLYVRLHTLDEADPGNVLAMGSTLVTAVWGDALARTLMRLRGWEVSSSVEIHPAGAVGKRAAGTSEDA